MTVTPTIELTQLDTGGYNTLVWRVGTTDKQVLEKQLSIFIAYRSGKRNVFSICYARYVILLPFTVVVVVSGFEMNIKTHERVFVGINMLICM